VVDSYFHAFDVSEFNCRLVSGDGVASVATSCELRSIEETSTEVIPSVNTADVANVEELLCTHLNDICSINFTEPCYDVGPDAGLALRDKCSLLIDRVYASQLTMSERAAAPM
jgi:hypothetical protein